MKDNDALRARVLTTADTHQSRWHYQGLARVVAERRPDVVAIVGDSLEAFSGSGKYRYSVEERT